MGASQLPGLGHSLHIHDHDRGFVCEYARVWILGYASMPRCPT